MARSEMFAVVVGYIQGTEIISEVYRQGVPNDQKQVVYQEAMTWLEEDHDELAYDAWIVRDEEFQIKSALEAAEKAIQQKAEASLQDPDYN